LALASFRVAAIDVTDANGDCDAHISAIKALGVWPPPTKAPNTTALIVIWSPFQLLSNPTDFDGTLPLVAALRQIDVVSKSA
jgi:hypothetical protein